MRLLIIEDDTALCSALSLHLSNGGYDVDVCNSGTDAAYYLRDSAYSAIILDRMLPGMDGLTLLKRLRETGDVTPVLMLTAMDAICDRTAGLDAGADDYLVKPFAMPELLSRVRALMRRPAGLGEMGRLTFLDLTLDARKCLLRRGSAELTLSRKEAAVLELLFEHSEMVLSRAQILSRVWGGDEPVEEGNVDNYIYFVRKRLKTLGTSAAIKSIHGVGYTLVNGL
ncbi:MAG: response regulator transcription factor [Clostridia bacterium]